MRGTGLFTSVFIHRLLVCAGLLPFGAVGQTYPDKELLPVTVTETRGQHPKNGSRTYKPDSLDLMQFSGTSLNDLLAYTTPIFIKNYGPGSIATMSFRGTSASHTAVVWNGFNLQNTMRGQPDLSLLPIGAIDEIQVQAGGNSSMYGSGAIGGSIYLQSRIGFKDDSTRYTIQWGAGQFGNRQSILKVYVPFSARTRFLVKSYYNTAENNFTFTNTALPFNPEMKQTHAQYFQEGVQADVEHQFNKQQKLTFHYWYHHNWRELPATMLQTRSQATQRDVSHKLTGDWNRVLNRIVLQFRTGYFYDELRYADPLSVLVSNNYTHNLTSEAEVIYQGPVVKNCTHALRGGFSNNLLWANARDYASEKFQWRNAVFGGYQFSVKKFFAHANARAERIDKVFTPLTFSLGTEWEFIPSVTLKLRGSKNYRYPTFNDLYWNPGGNKNLKPENSVNAETGLMYRKNFKRWLLRAEATVFSNSVTNWITWLPDPVNPNVWSPQNVAEVWSRGVEYTLQTEWQLSTHTQLGVSGLYTWVESTNEKLTTGYTDALHRQLVYIPRQNASFRLFIRYKKLTCSYAHGYTGLRFVTVDNYEYLNPYQVASFHINYASRVGKRFRFPFTVFLTAKNVWDEQYQVMIWRPMPGRYVEAGLKLQFAQKIKFNKTNTR